MTNIEKILVLQDRDRKILSLTQESVDIPARKQLIEQRLKDHHDAIAKAHEDLKRNAAGIKDVELEIESRKLRILKLREQQGSIKTNQEYRAIEHEIAALQEQIRGIEEREIELMEAAEALKARQAEVEAVLKREKEFVESDLKNLDARLQNIGAEIEAVKAEREKVLPDVDPEWLSRYQRIFANKGDVAMVPVEGGSCGGCHMRLPPQQVHLARRGTDMVACSFCGRLLYSPPA